MPKKAFLANHLNSSELKRKYLTSLDPVDSRIWYVLWKVSLGWTIKNSAIAVGLTYQYAKVIVKKSNETGSKGIKNYRRTTHQHRRGKTPLLNEQQLQKLF